MAFGDIVDDKIDDKVITNNNDFVKVMSTVAKAIYEFVKRYPEATIEINPLDVKRQAFYNHIFRRRFKEIEQFFVVRGIINNQILPYDPACF